MKRNFHVYEKVGGVGGVLMETHFSRDCGKSVGRKNEYNNGPGPPPPPGMSIMSVPFPFINVSGVNLKSTPVR